jgi:hypothetical protein
MCNVAQGAGAIAQGAGRAERDARGGSGAEERGKE